MRSRMCSIRENEWPDSTIHDVRRRCQFIDYNGKKVEADILAIDTEYGDAIIVSKENGAPIIENDQIKRERAMFIAPLKAVWL